jgi:hypothetical protein
MPDTKNTETNPAGTGDQRRPSRPSDAKLSAVVEAAYILEAIRR